MADATPVKFEQESAKKFATKAALTIKAQEAEAGIPSAPTPAVDPVVPVAGDTFTPLRGKTGVYHTLQGSPSLVKIVTH